MAYRSNTIECDVNLIKESEKAYLVSDGDYEVWIPKSQARLIYEKGIPTKIELPEWLAMEKGLI